MTMARCGFMTDEISDHDTCRDPVFILTGSRSGSTLLRFILDTHPEFACPPETMITAACLALLRSWDILENASSGRQRLVTEPPRLPADAIQTVHDVVDRIYGRYLARRGKPRWCDKSLDSILNADLLAELFPQARFVCLYRHCMDVIASGAEACPWGVSRFGFDPYVAQNPGNTVAAIGSYWSDIARTMLAFEESHPERCYRVRYEDLATAPENVTAGLLDFLGAAPAPGITTACFSTPHEGDGPGDEKIWFTTEVSGDTMGRGVNVPAGALPPQQCEQINESLRKLGYREIGENWNDAAGPVDPRLPDTAGAAERNPDANGAAPAPAGPDATPPPVVQALEARIQSRVPGETPSVWWPAVAGQTITLVVADDGRSSELNVTFPQRAPADGNPAGPDADGSDREAATNGAGPGPVATMIATSRVWQAILDGTANMIVEIRAGRLRCVNRRDTHRVRSDEVHAIAWLLGLAQVPLVRDEDGELAAG
jgi:protein-tyrosine sulfotransferase